MNKQQPINSWFNHVTRFYFAFPPAGSASLARTQPFRFELTRVPAWLQSNFLTPSWSCYLTHTKRNLSKPKCILIHAPYQVDRIHILTLILNGTGIAKNKKPLIFKIKQKSASPLPDFTKSSIIKKERGKMHKLTLCQTCLGREREVILDAHMGKAD